MIAIVDYGMGNLRNVSKAFRYVGHESIVTSDPTVISSCDKIVLPGVGAFGDAIKILESSGLGDLIKDEVQKGKYLLGICLGMQLLSTKSFEFGEHRGLDLIPGEVVRFDVPLKIPHIGWNDTVLNGEGGIFDEGCYYFVHSYHYETDNANVALYSDYGKRFVAAVRRDNVFGAQFHPEKSGDKGLEILKRFGDLR